MKLILLTLSSAAIAATSVSARAVPNSAAGALVRRQLDATAPNCGQRCMVHVPYSCTQNIGLTESHTNALGMRSKLLEIVE